MCLYCICIYCVFVCLLFWFLLVSVLFFFFFKQKTAYEMRISDWSSDVCSSDLAAFALMAETGPVKVKQADRGSWFSHKAEEARPYSYKVYQIGRASCRERVCQYV